MKVRIDGKLQDFDDIPQLEDAISEALDMSHEDGYNTGREIGEEDGYDEGYDAARRDLIPEQENTHRETDFRRSLYRAIYAGNIEEAENIINLMAMVDIDRDLIWEARK